MATLYKLWTCVVYSEISGDKWRKYPSRVVALLVCLEVSGLLVCSMAAAIFAH
jgi:hypothetical protein